MRHALALRLGLALAGLAALLGTSRPGQADDPKEPPKDPALEAAREAKIKDLKRDLKKWAQGPYATEHKDEIGKALDALTALGGPPAAEAALEAVFDSDTEVRDKAFQLVEKIHDKSLVAPLGALIEHKDLRRDWDLHKRIAHALTVTAHASAIAPLTTLVQSEDEHVVAGAADGLATFAEAKIEEKREAVQRMLEVYESTWNLKESVRPEDQKQAKVMHAKWEVYGAPLRRALQALTFQQIARPKDWRKWWNEHRKDAKWVPGAAPDPH